MNDRLSKQDGELFDDYCHRISSLKDELQLTWVEIAEYINQEYNVNYSDTYYRKKEKSLLDKELMQESLSTDDYYSKLLELKKQKIKISDERIQANAALRQIAREETIKEIAKDYAEIMNKSMILTRKDHTISDNPKEAILLLSDWHYGLDIDNFYNTYNIDIAKERIQQLQNFVEDYCVLNNVTNINIINLGDLIAGNIHLTIRLNSRIDVITQIMDVSELLAQFIYNLNEHFTIDYYSVCDNHSRLDPNKKDSIELESLCRITDWYLQERVPFINYHENKFGNNIASFEINKYKVAAVHGHQDKQNTVIQTLNNFTNDHYDLICTAHLHHFTADEHCNTLMISNGSLMGTDQFAFDLRLASEPSQTLIICSKYNVAEAIYRIPLV